MAIITKREIRARASGLTKSASTVLNESYFAFSNSRSYDIFLSHSYLDANDIVGLKMVIEDMGYSVYVDWLVDRQLDRANVNQETAALLRKRMESCQSLFFATSDNSSNSKWMPWELGYFDGIKRKVAILPIGDRLEYDFCGQEYLGLYPYVMKDQIQGGSREALWIHSDNETYVIFESWLEGVQPFRRRIS